MTTIPWRAQLPWVLLALSLAAVAALSIDSDSIWASWLVGAVAFATAEIGPRLTRRLRSASERARRRP